jgi:hypothetical protein
MNAPVLSAIMTTLYAARSASKSAHFTRTGYFQRCWQFSKAVCAVRKIHEILMAAIDVFNLPS